jgi:predicted O-methyltransferase YrrM
LEELYRTGQVRTPDGEVLEATAYASAELGRWLQGIVSGLGAETALEVGLAQGVSALFVADVLKRTPRTRLIAIDPLQEQIWKNVGLGHLTAAGHQSILEFHQLPSHEALPKLEAAGTTLDFAFIDGWHTFDYALVDFFYIDRMMRVGGVIALDDCQYPSVRKLCRYIATNLAYSVDGCFSEKDDPGFPARHRVLQAGRRIARPLSRLLRPEIVEPDPELGLRPGARSIAFRKESRPARHWHFHQRF